MRTPALPLTLPSPRGESKERPVVARIFSYPGACEVRGGATEVAPAKRLGVTTIMVTHDQEEALTMADHIVVMQHGRMEQIGTPLQLYAQPVTPFVTDFLGKMNFFPGTRLTPQRLIVAGAEPVCLPQRDPAGPDTPVTVCLRPEDVVVRDSPHGAANRFVAQVGVMAFLGHHFVTTLHVLGTPLHVLANLSIHDVRDLEMASGKTISISLPPRTVARFSARATAAGDV